MVEQYWWKSNGETEVVKNLQWNSNGGTLVVEQ